MIKLKLLKMIIFSKPKGNSLMYKNFSLNTSYYKETLYIKDENTNVERGFYSPLLTQMLDSKADRIVNKRKRKELGL